ncbi:MAG: hypothetical protein VCA36_04635 [Opitutales bacterium]
MERRQFLTIGGAGGGGCFFTRDVFRLFSDYYDNHGAPLLEETPKSTIDKLYVEPECGTISLNSSQEDEIRPVRFTWNEYLVTRLGYVPTCSEGWREASEYFNLLPPPSFGRLRKELKKKGDYCYEVDDLDETIPEDLQSFYEQNHWLMEDSPASQAYHFLDRLDIGNLESDPNALSTGELDFVHCPAPFNNSTFVTLEGRDPEVAASCLQRRLNELVGNVEVIYG